MASAWLDSQLSCSLAEPELGNVSRFCDRWEEREGKIWPSHGRSNQEQSASEAAAAQAQVQAFSFGASPSFPPRPEPTIENLGPGGPENLDSLTVNTHSESREGSKVQNEDAEMADTPPDNSNDVRVGPLETPATLPHIEGLSLPSARLRLLLDNTQAWTIIRSPKSKKKKQEEKAVMRMSESRGLSSYSHLIAQPEPLPLSFQP